MVEAEAAQIGIAQGEHTWEQRTDLPGYSGSGYMVAVPDDGTVVDQEVTARSPELRFLVAFPQPGTYYVWMRGWASNGGSDSVWVGLGDDDASQVHKIEGFAPGSWVWAPQTAEHPVTLIVPAPGLYALHIWMREDGFALDQIALSREPAVPAGVGGIGAEPELLAPPGALGEGLVPAATARPGIAGDGTGGP